MTYLLPDCVGYKAGDAVFDQDWRDVPHEANRLARLVGGRDVRFRGRGLFRLGQSRGLFRLRQSSYFFGSDGASPSRARLATFSDGVMRLVLPFFITVVTFAAITKCRLKASHAEKQRMNVRDIVRNLLERGPRLLGVVTGG